MKLRAPMLICAAVLPVTVLTFVGRPGLHAAEKTLEHGEGLLKPPPVLQEEHRELHQDLRSAQQAGGETAQAAEKVARLLSAHFEEEEQYALPPIGLLRPLSQGKATPEMKPAIEMADKLRANYPKMLAEHQQIVEALKQLESAAKAENKPEQAEFARRLMLHAQNEEQVLYPATLVIGDYLKLKLEG